jgi:hypothetical protein
MFGPQVGAVCTGFGSARLQTARSIGYTIVVPKVISSSGNAFACARRSNDATAATSPRERAAVTHGSLRHLGSADGVNVSRAPMSAGRGRPDQRRRLRLPSASRVKSAHAAGTVAAASSTLYASPAMNGTSPTLSAAEPTKRASQATPNT